VVKRQQLKDISAKYEKLANHLKSKGSNKWLVAGYCWGAWVAFYLSSLYDNMTAIAAMHPSFQCEFFYGGTDLDLAKKIKAPAFLYAAGNDQENVKTNGAITKILEERFKDKTGVVEFPKQQHGWMVRSDPKDPEANKDIESCFKLSQEYFNKFA
jgi:dienelactone hydrolase